jgi:catechol 2,3-dioxygenase-like lactoylglutathione lyase family enzyme
VGAIECVTVGVSDAQAALALYRDVFKLRIDQLAAVPAARSAAWGLPPDVSATCLELSCAGYPVGRLRLLATDLADPGHVRQDLDGESDSPYDIGPKAMDFYPPTTVAEAIEELEAAGFPARSRPVAHEEGGLASHELLFTGPDGVGVLVMEGEHGDLWRDRAPAAGYSEVSTLAIIGADPEATTRFYAEGLGLTCALDVTPPAEAADPIAEIAGMARGTRLRLLLFRESGEPSGKVLVVHPVDAPGPRLRDRMRPGRIGIALATVRVDDLDAAIARTTRAGGVVERGPVAVETGRVALLRGPNEELFELDERG